MSAFLAVTAKTTLSAVVCVAYHPITGLVLKATVICVKCYFAPNIDLELDDKTILPGKSRIFFDGFYELFTGPRKK